jgi:hypothetical protein
VAEQGQWPWLYAEVRTPVLPACSLSTADAGSQLDEWRQLLAETPGPVGCHRRSWRYGLLGGRPFSSMLAKVWR